MSDALEHVRYSCGIAGEEVANYVDQLQDKVAELEAENARLREALKEMLEYAGIIEERCDSVATTKARAAIRESEK